MVLPNNIFGTGRIEEIISALQHHYGVTDISELSAKQKLDALCQSMQLSINQFDRVMADNSPVMRTVKGHAFEIVFDELVRSSGNEIEEVGGDSDIDRIVNGINLQLKTPTASGTSGRSVQYKTHKTHGAKSEQESLAYYHALDEFADYLVGLISYDPLRIIVLSRDELPIHPLDRNRIRSPFNVDWGDHPALNAYNRIFLPNLAKYQEYVLPDPDNELLPLTTKMLGLNSDVILDTILRKSNFRIWDMAFRGFAREIVINDRLKNAGVMRLDPVKFRPERGDKADTALRSASDGKLRFFQTKGVSTNNCKFSGVGAVVAIETQLTRGRINDHVTQSRLYLRSDFDYLLIGLDPCFVYKYRELIGRAPDLCWEFYAIPTDELDSHHELVHRIKPLQKFRYRDLSRYLMDDDWLNQWMKK